jgi:hypothetical protein
MIMDLEHRVALAIIPFGIQFSDRVTLIEKIVEIVRVECSLAFIDGNSFEPMDAENQETFFKIYWKQRVIEQ